MRNHNDSDTAAPLRPVLPMSAEEAQFQIDLLDAQALRRALYHKVNHLTQYRCNSEVRQEIAYDVRELLVSVDIALVRLSEAE